MARSVAANYALQLERYEEAYTAIIQNEDEERYTTIVVPSSHYYCSQLNDLSRFISVVCENGQIQYLNELPFLNLVQKVETILQEKAKKSDLFDGHPLNYYDVLASFCTFRNNFYRAACLNLDLAKRLHNESASQNSEILDKESMYMTASLSALRLIEQSGRWLLELDQSSLKRNRVGTSAMQNLCMLLIFVSFTLDIAITPISESEMEKHALVAQIKLQLAKNGTMPPSVCTPAELIHLSVRVELYDSAVSLCKLVYNNDLTLFFGSLGAKCAQLQLTRYAILKIYFGVL